MGFFNFLKVNTNPIASLPNNFDAYSVPTIIFDYQEIVSNHHADQRILTHYLNKSQTTPLESIEYASKELGGTKRAIKLMSDLGWLEEKSHKEILSSLYSAEELREFLKSHGLKTSGKKEEIIDRLLDSIPFEQLNRRYKTKLYNITPAGLAQIQHRTDDYDKAVDNAIQAVRDSDFEGALVAFNLYDATWGFSRSSGWAYTIFSKSVIQSKRFTYILKYPMKELKNSEDFKRDLRAVLFVALMQGKKRGGEVAPAFERINTELIICPTILSMYLQDRGDMDKTGLLRMINAMKERIKDEPNSVLEYYISKILYKSIPQY